MQNDSVKMVLVFGSIFVMLLPLITWWVAENEVDLDDYFSADSLETADSLAVVDSLEREPDPALVVNSQMSQIDSLQKELNQITQMNEAIADSILAANSAALTGSQRISEKQAKDMAKIYDKMSAEDAAMIINGLEVPIAIEVIARMKKRQAAKVMAAMHPAKAISLSKEMALRD